MTMCNVVRPGHIMDALTECPRCRSMHDGQFYGPCVTCREALRATMGATPRHVEVAEYEPKMNVTPNAVALKDD